MSQWKENRIQTDERMSRQERLLGLLSQLPDEMLEEALDYRVIVQETVRSRLLKSMGWLAACIGIVILSRGALQNVGDMVFPTDGRETTIAGLPTEAQTPGGPTFSETTSQGGFWYGGTWYEAQAGETLMQLPEGAEACATLFLVEPPEGGESTEDKNAVGKDWQTDSDRLVGRQVYRDEAGVFYVEEDSLYRCYRPVSTAEEIPQQSGEEVQ